MEKRIKEYLKTIDELIAKLDKESAPSTPEMLNSHLVQISFFQHERLVHLIVTVLFAIMEMLSLIMAVTAGGIGPIALTLAILILLVPYVRHYYILENGVQKMYRQYDLLMLKKQ